MMPGDFVSGIVFWPGVKITVEGSVVLVDFVV